MYKFLQINMVNRIVSGMWESKIDIGGSVFEIATSYDLTFGNELEFQEDTEKRRRFYMPRDQPNPHFFSFAVWKKSMSLRHLIEIMIFFLLLVVFQYEVSKLNVDLHLSIEELAKFREIEALIVERGGYSLY